MSAKNTNRDKGHNTERHYASEFRKLGHMMCLTSRYASRMHDDALIDLVGIPVNLQIKAGKQTGMKPHKVLAEMREKIAAMFPEGSPERERPCAVLHRKEWERGKKRTKEGEMVYMTFYDFAKLMAKPGHEPKTDQ